MNKHNKHLSLIILLCFLLFQNLTAQNKSTSYSLKEAQDYALKNNYNVKNALLDVASSKKKIWETTAIGLPQIRANAGYQDDISVPTIMFPDFLSPYIYGVLLQEGLIKQSQIPSGGTGLFAVQMGTQHNANFGFSATQMIFNGAYFVGLQAAKIFLQISEQSQQKTETDIRQNVAKSYYLILVAKENKRMLDSSGVIIDRTYNEVVQMNKNGFADTMDIQQLKIAVANVENTIKMLGRQIDIAMRLLKFQMGIDIDQDIELTDQLDIMISQLNPLEMLAKPFDVNSNLDIKIMKTQEVASYLMLKRERTAYYPTLDASFSYNDMAMRTQFNFFDFSQPWYPSAILGFSLNVPIFSSGMRHARVAQAKYQIEKSEISRIQVEQATKLEYIQAKSEFQNTFESYSTKKDNLLLAQSIYLKTLIKYKTGVSTSMELTQNQNQYLSIQNEYYNSILELLNAKTRLEKVLQTN